MQQEDYLEESDEDIVQIGGGLLYFVQNAVLPVYSGSKQLNLMDLFPLAKQGLASYRLLLSVVDMYFLLNNLSATQGLHKIDVTFDDLFTKSFLGNIPAIFYIHSDDGIKRVPIQEAIQQGLTNYATNTIQHPSSDMFAFHGFTTIKTIRLLIMSNSIPLEQVPGVKNIYKTNSSQIQLMKNFLWFEIYLVLLGGCTLIMLS